MLGVANKVWMLENAVHLVLILEGYASILWKDSTRAGEAAELIKLKSGDLYRMQVADKFFSEPYVLNVESMEHGTVVFAVGGSV